MNSTIRFISHALLLPICFSGELVAAEDLTNLGGSFTATLPGRHAIQVAAPFVTNVDHRTKQLLGFSLFHRVVGADQGLGPRFNNASCAGCHINNGRGRVGFKQHFSTLSSGNGMVVRVALKGSDLDGSPKDLPGIGEQLQERHLLGKTSYNLQLSWRNTRGRYGDGTSYQLRSPILKFRIPGRNQRSVLHTLLMTPTVIGVGLIDAISEETILKQSDPDDLNRDGISGRANWVPNRSSGRIEVGRFGFKASQPTLVQQTAAALFHDMGITNPLFNGAAAGVSAETSTSELELLFFYQALAGIPPARDQEQPQVARGKQLFQALNCSGCHTMNVTTGATEDERALQTIHPFTDLLLHDLGPGLASTRGDFGASAREWRTTPLWGLGFSEVLAEGHARYLHDGRARTIPEAILWHGGEALASREAFRKLPKQDREALVAFLRSL